MKRLVDKFLHSAWEPFTPRGVAAFSRASFRRLLLAQLLVAVFSSVCVVWVLANAWMPVIREAIQQLPPEGRISHGQLSWRGESPARLAANDFLSLGVDLRHEGKLSREAHVAVEFARADVRCHSLLGYRQWPYPRGWVIAANQPELEPWWNAWEPSLLAGIAAVTVTGLLLSWAGLAAFYSVLVRLFGYFTNRNLDWSGSFKLAAAALMPGALFMTLSIAGYGVGWFGLVQLGLAFAFHLVIGWIYLLVSPAMLPRDPEIPPAKANPFAGS